MTAGTSGLYQVTAVISGASGSGPHYNIWHMATGAGANPTDTQVNNAAQQIQVFYGAIKSFFCAGASLVCPNKIVNVGVDPPLVVPSSNTPVAATGTGTSPPQCSALVSWTSSVATRRGRGRTFLGPLSSTAPSGTSGDLTSANVTTLQTAANALITNLAAAAPTWVLAIANRDDTGKLIGYVGVTGAIARSHVYTQRRRAY